MKCMLILLGAFWLFASALPARADNSPPISSAAPTPALAQLVQGVGIDQKLGTQVPLNLTFRDESGAKIQLSDLRRDHPIVLAFVAYRCPSLCTVVLNDMMSTLKVIPQNIGQQYDVWTISFDPRETPDLAAQKKSEYLKSYQRARPSAAQAATGWHFLTGDDAAIHSFTDAVGFHYKWDQASQQYIHPAGLIILTPEGKVARYFFGVDFDPTDLRLSLVESSDGKIGTLTDQILLYCYHYDPTTGKYGLVIFRALQIGGALTLGILTLALTLLWKTDRRRTQAGLAATAPLPSPPTMPDHKEDL